MMANKPIYLYINKETGEVLTKEEMLKQGKELYDLGDDTNIFDYSDYYERL